MLLNPEELTIENLSNDLATERSRKNRLEWSLLAIQEGLQTADNPVERIERSKTIVVEDFETLPGIALRELGSADYWEAIAKENRIQYPYVVHRGQILKLPTNLMRNVRT
ncbi:MAG: hypothetical protein LRZ84_14495 [Desertifilum sp.]|nr:hypothetical protein [Desertifilum sp.]